MDKEDKKINEDSKNLVELLLPRLQLAHQTVDELVKVYKEYGKDFNMEKAYDQEIDELMKESDTRKQPNHPAGSRSNLPGQSTYGPESTGMKTAKLNTGMVTEKSVNIRR